MDTLRVRGDDGILLSRAAVAHLTLFLFLPPPPPPPPCGPVLLCFYQGQPPMLSFLAACFMPSASSSPTLRLRRLLELGGSRVGVSSFGEASGEPSLYASLLPVACGMLARNSTEQNRGSLAGRSVPSNASTVNKGGRDGLWMDCDCDARGAREGEGDTETDSVQFISGGERDRTNQRWGRRTGGSLKKCSQSTVAF